MTEKGLWSDYIYQETIVLVLLFLFLLSATFFFLQKRGPKFLATWASLKSWLFVAPLLAVAIGLPRPWPLIGLVLICIYGSKTFYRMVGMYHRNWFILITYAFIVLLGYGVYRGDTGYYDLSPMIFLGAISFVPILRNNYSHMIQYLALSLLAFLFFGWSMMHLGRVLLLEQGIYIALYVYILSEFAESVNLIVDRSFGRLKPLSKISARFSIEGLLVSLILTTLLAWGLRHLLPDRTEPFWIMSGVVVTIFGRCGELLMSVIRRDLELKESGLFIIGRDDIIARLDKLIFVAPIFYYCYITLQSMTF